MDSFARILMGNMSNAKPDEFTGIARYYENKGEYNKVRDVKFYFNLYKPLCIAQCEQRRE